MDTVLFDLDGTLLPMDQDEFVRAYFKELVKKSAPLGFDTKKLIDGIWYSTGAMVKNDGAQTNEDVFWAVFSKVMNQDMNPYKPFFDEFYANEFNNAMAMTRPEPLAVKCVKRLKEKGYKLVLATNPIFPAAATFGRIRWAGLEAADFELVTTYENSAYAKPNPKYFEEVIHKIAKRPADCIMVGNDATEDTAAAKLGIPVFLVTRCLIEQEPGLADPYEKGEFSDLFEKIEMLPDLAREGV